MRLRYVLPEHSHRAGQSNSRLVTCRYASGRKRSNTVCGNRLLTSVLYRYRSTIFLTQCFIYGTLTIPSFYSSFTYHVFWSRENATWHLSTQIILQKSRIFIINLIRDSCIAILSQNLTKLNLDLYLCKIGEDNIFSPFLRVSKSF